MPFTSDELEVAALNPLSSALRWRPVVWAGLYGALILVGAVFVGHVDLLSDVRNLVHDGVLGPPILVAILLLYAALLACPFVPGAEIGLFLLVWFGAELAVPVYLATVAALMLSFSFGRLMPVPVLSAILMRIRLMCLAERLNSMSGASESTMREEMSNRVSNPWLRGFLRHRGLALIVLINTPGNAVLGGGGGIAMAAGISRLITYREFLLTVSFAVAPVPAALGFAAWFAS